MNETMENTEVIADTETDTKSDTIAEEDVAEFENETSPENTATHSTDESVPDDNSINYEEVIKNDLSVLKTEFPELKGISDITELDNPLRYAALRDLGLDPTEAYLATAKRVKHDNRSHLTAAYGKSAVTPSGMMSQRELMEAREIFGNLGDSEIQRLYRKVTG